MGKDKEYKLMLKDGYELSISEKWKAYQSL